MIRKLLLATAAVSLLAACVPEDTSKRQSDNKTSQAQKAREAANSITFTDNEEIENIKKRIILTAKPGLLGFIVLLNASGQPVLATTVEGKVSSGSKRLTEPDRLIQAGNGSGGLNMAIRQAPSEDGTYGSSADYIFFWTTSGQYIQWKGDYLYSDQPIRLNVQPIAVTIERK